MNFVTVVISFAVTIGLNCFLCSANECDGNSAKNHVKKLFDDLRAINKEAGLTLDDSCLKKNISDPSQIEWYVQRCGINNGSTFICKLKELGLYDKYPDIRKKVDEHVNYFTKYLKKCNWYDNSCM